MVNRRNFLRGAVVAAATVGGTGNVLAGSPPATADVVRKLAETTTCVIAGPVNGGFEEPVVDGQIPGWTQTFGRATTFEVVDTRASEGTRSLRIVDDATNDALGLRSDLFAAVENEFFLASAQAYLEQGTVSLYLYFHDSAGALLATYNRPFSTVQDGWQTIAVGATAPARTAQAAVLVYSPAAARSTFHVDDVRVQRLGPRVETFGPSALTAAMQGLVILDGYAYTAARGLLAEIDLGSRTLRRAVPFGGNGTAWGMTTSNGKVYFGVDLAAYVFDPANGEVSLLGSLGSGAGTTWCMTTAPDGMVYAGVYPAGQVWEISPATGTLRNLGAAVPGQQYARVVAADDAYVYAGTQPTGHVVAYDRATGEKHDITAPLEDLPGVTVMIAANGRVSYGAGTRIVDMRPDGSDVRTLSLPDGIADAMAVGADGTLYLTGRATGSVYRRVGDELVPIATPITLEETRALFAIDERTLLGAGGSGALWWVDTETGEVTMIDLADLGLAEPEPAQSLTLGHDGETVYVAGSSIVTAHGPRYPKPLRFRVPGQSKQMRFVNGHLYAATYPRTEIIELNIRINRARSLGIIGRPQYRPLAMEYDPVSKYLLVGTAPENGQLAGALTLVDIRRRTLEVLADILPDQAVTSIALDRGIAYLAGDAMGVSVPPTQASATIAAFDVVNRRKLWEVAPLAGHRSIAGIAVHEGVLYGVNKRISGAWFTMDLRTQRVISQGQLPGTHSYGELTVHQDRVYAAVHDGLTFLLGPDLDEPRLVLDGLTDGFPQTLPQLAFEPESWLAWSMDGLDLARLNLEPDC